MTIVPYTCDYMVGSVATFANIGISLQNSQSTRVLRLVGDATHDETGQRLKVLRIGVAVILHILNGAPLFFQE